MSHLGRGFVVPAWVRLGTGSAWLACWASRCRNRFALPLSDFVYLIYPDDQLRPRDPNRKDKGDRPDLLEAS